MGLFSSSSDVRQTTSVVDQRFAAEGDNASANSVRLDGGIDGYINIGSDQVALASIFNTNELARGSNEIASEVLEASNEALLLSSNFLADTFSEVLNLTDQSLQRADTNIRAQQETTAQILAKEQESSDDRLIKIVTFGLIGAGAIVFIQAGGIKQFGDVFKAITGVFK